MTNRGDRMGDRGGRRNTNETRVHMERGKTDSDED